MQPYFQGQYLEDKKHHVSCEFLHKSFNDNTCKMYFYFLDFILPLVNKFNINFQGLSSSTQVLWWYVSIPPLHFELKTEYLKNTPLSNVDPQASQNYVPIKNMYLGVNVTKNLNLIGDKNIIDDFHNRCQSFHIILSVELKKRLPIKSEIFRELRFLDSQTAVNDDFVISHSFDIEILSCSKKPWARYW